MSADELAARAADRPGNETEAAALYSAAVEALLKSTPPPRPKSVDSKARELMARIRALKAPSQAARFKDIVGHAEPKRVLYDALILARQHPRLFEPDERPPRSLLLYGPPGTGKTQLARAAAGESGMRFFYVAPSDILNKWQGGSEANIKQLFDTAAAAQPSIIFFDEVDALTQSRTEGEHSASTRVAELLQKFEAAPPGVFIIGATNVPWHMDTAVLRRFAARIFVDLPSADERVQMLAPALLSDDDAKSLAERTAGFSGSDIANLIQAARSTRRAFVLNATHFRTENGKTVATNPCGECANEACSACGAFVSTFEDAKPELGPMRLEFFVIGPPTSNPASVERFRTWQP